MRLTSKKQMEEKRRNRKKTPHLRFSASRSLAELPKIGIFIGNASKMGGNFPEVMSIFDKI